MIFDKIAKKYTVHQDAICFHATHALINFDEQVQTRAAKVINRYGDPKNQVLIEQLTMYAGELLYASKQLLEEFIEENKEANEDAAFTPEKVLFLSEESRLSSYDSLDDLIFFVSQAIDNNQVYDVELLLSLLPKLNVLLSKDNVAKIEPILIRSFNLITNFNTWNSQIGMLEIEAAVYLNNYSEILMNRFPEALVDLKKLKEKKDREVNSESYFYANYLENLKEIESKPVPDYIYRIHRLLFVKSKIFLQKNIELSLLSTPTHAPCWLEPEALIKRVKGFESKRVQIELWDWQIAVGRLPLNEYSSDIADKIETMRAPKLENVLKYFYGFLDLKQIEIENPELFLPAVLSRNVPEEIEYYEAKFGVDLRSERGLVTWHCTSQEYKVAEYNYSTRTNHSVTRRKKKIVFDNINPITKQEKSLTEKLIRSFKKQEDIPVNVSSYYEHLRIKSEGYGVTLVAKDDVKFLYLSPNNPNVLLQAVMANILTESDNSGETSKQNTLNLLNGLHEIWCRKDYGESTYLFLAYGMLCSDRVAGELAAETWIKTTVAQNMDQAFLGAILGELEQLEFAPLKRFTDMMGVKLFNVSKEHNKQLIILLEAIKGKIHEERIKGLKRLLEIYFELQQSFPEFELDVSVQSKLQKWRKSASLKVLTDRNNILSKSV